MAAAGDGAYGWDMPASVDAPETTAWEDVVPPTPVSVLLRNARGTVVLEDLALVLRAAPGVAEVVFPQAPFPLRAIVPAHSCSPAGPQAPGIPPTTSLAEAKASGNAAYLGHAHITAMGFWASGTQACRAHAGTPIGAPVLVQVPESDEDSRWAMRLRWRPAMLAGGEPDEGADVVYEDAGQYRGAVEDEDGVAWHRVVALPAELGEDGGQLLRACFLNFAKAALACAPVLPMDLSHALYAVDGALALDSLRHHAQSPAAGSAWLVRAKVFAAARKWSTAKALALQRALPLLPPAQHDSVHAFLASAEAGHARSARQNRQLARSVSEWVGRATDGMG